MPRTRLSNPTTDLPTSAQRRGKRMRQALIAGAALLAGLGVSACEGGSTGAPASDSKTPSVDATAMAASGDTRTEAVGSLRFVVPDAWVSQTPQSSMRIAQYEVPGEGGPASLVLFRFPGGGGSADANVARWIQQFSQPDGTPTQDRAVVQNATVGSVTLTRLDVSGTYGGQQMPGAPAQPALADARLLALIVEGSGDPYFFKLQGPASTVGAWAEAWEALVQSLVVE